MPNTAIVGNVLKISPRASFTSATNTGCIMTDPKKPSENDENLLENLEELEETPSPVASHAAQPLDPDLTDLSALFEEDSVHPRDPGDATDKITNGSDNSASIPLHESDESDASGAFQVLDESALNDAADRTDASDVSGALSDPDISDILESFGEKPGDGTTATRASAGMLTSSNPDSSGDLEILEIPASSDANAPGIIPTEDSEPVNPSKTPRKTKDISKGNNPVQQPAKGGKGGGLLAGSVLGLVAGLAITQGLWLFGLELPASIRQADPGHVAELKSLVQKGKDEGSKAATLEGELALAQKSSQELAEKAKGDQDKLLAEKTSLAGQLADQAKTHASLLKSEQAKGEKSLTDARAQAAKVMDAFKADSQAAMAKMGKDHETTKAQTKADLDKAAMEISREKSRSAELEGKLESEARGWGTLAGKLKAAGLGESKAHSAGVIPLVEKAVGMAMVKDPSGEIRKLTMQMAEEKNRLEREIAAKSAQIASQGAELARRRPPAEALEYWRPLLLADMPGPSTAAEAAKDAAFALALAPANSPEASKARVVAALADASQGRLAEAKKWTTGMASLPPGPWAETAKALEGRLASPSTAALARARAYAEEGKGALALEILTKANTSPLANDPALPRLRAELALMLLGAEKPDMAKVQSLAAESAKTGEALGFYVQGRILEAQGNPGAAGLQYSQAIVKAQAKDPMLLQYRLARVRLLGTKTGVSARFATGEADTAALAAWLLVATTLVDAETLVVPDPRERARKQEIRKILDDPSAPPLLKAQVLLENDQPLHALVRLQEHLASQKKNSEPETVRLLASIINALESKAAGTESLTLPPQARRAEAQRLFGIGKRQVLSRQWDQAEETLELATKYAGKEIDARFFYFLGLALLGQEDSRGADRYFLRALELERKNLPSPREVSRALEEVQGPARDKIDSIRYGAVLAPGSFR